MGAFESSDHPNVSTSVSHTPLAEMANRSSRSLDVVLPIYRVLLGVGRCNVGFCCFQV